MTKRWKIILGIISGLAVVIIIVLLSPFGRFVITGGLMDLNEQPFNQQQWKDARDAEPQVLRARLLMLEDLMENHLKNGLDSMTVKDMLGEPERQAGFSYALGTLTPGMDNVFLIVQFDGAGKVSDLVVKGEKNLEEGAGIKIKIEKD